MDDYDIGLFNEQPPVDPDLVNMSADELRLALTNERRKQREDDEQRKKDSAEEKPYKRATIIVDKKQWETVQRYCYTKGIKQGDFVKAALDMYLQTLNTSRLKKLPPDGIHRGGRPRRNS